MAQIPSELLIEPEDESVSKAQQIIQLKESMEVCPPKPLDLLHAQTSFQIKDLG